MAMAFASSSTITCTLNKPSCFTHNKTPSFLGVVKPSVTTTTDLCKQHSLHVRCQADDDSAAAAAAAAAVITREKKKKKDAVIPKEKKKAVIPIDQRWMFLDDDNDNDFSGPDIWNTTWYPKASDHINTEKTWYVVDATDKILGRLASTIAVHIRGKNLATYTPSVDMGAFVIVVNAEKVAVSGRKRLQKVYRRHSGRPGGMTVETFDQLQQRIPERIIEHAVRGMLPKGRLGRDLFTHLKVYKGPDHPHAAQMPIDLPLRDKRIQMVS